MTIEQEPTSQNPDVPPADPSVEEATDVVSGEVEKITSVKCVKVQLVEGYNYDQDDIRAGGSPILGPFIWVPQALAPAFAKRARGKYGSGYLKVEVGTGTRLLEAPEDCTVDHYWNVLEEYLAKLKVRVEVTESRF